MTRDAAVICLAACAAALGMGCSGDEHEIRELRKQLKESDDRAVQSEKRASTAGVSAAGLRDTLFKERQRSAAMKGEIASLQKDLRAARREADQFKDLAGQSPELIDFRNKVERQRRQLFARTIGELPVYQRQEFRVLRGKALAKTLTLIEYARLTELLGGPLAAYIAPGMDDVRKEVVRRTATQDPSMAAQLKSLHPDAFVGEPPAVIMLPEPPADQSVPPSKPQEERR